VKIGPVYSDIALLKGFFKKKQLTQAEHYYSPRACVPRGQKQFLFQFYFRGVYM